MDSVKHFSKEEWKLFYDNKIDENTRVEMEKHMQECNECLLVYLSIVDESCEMHSNDSVLSDEFTDNVMATIEKENNYSQTSIIEYNQALNKKQIQKQKKINLLVYYTAAACLTLFMMSRGIFSVLPYNFSSVASQITQTNTKIEKVIRFQWIEQFTDNTTNILNDLFD